MSKTVMYIEFKLKKNACVSDFLASAKKLNDEYMSKQKGYLSWQQLVTDEKIWADVITWKTMEDAKAIFNPSDENPLAEEFYSFINMMSCKVRLYSIEKDYK